MIIGYGNSKVERQCTDLREAKRSFPDKVARKLHMLINFIEAADNLQSIISNPSYNFHDLKGKKKSLYAMDIDGRRSSYRLIVTFDDCSNAKVFNESLSIQAIEIEEVSKHYE